MRVQFLPQGLFQKDIKEVKVDEIRRRLETGWTVTPTVVGRDHWPPSFLNNTRQTNPSLAWGASLPLSADFIPVAQQKSSRSITGRSKVRNLPGIPVS